MGTPWQLHLWRWWTRLPPSLAEPHPTPEPVNLHAALPARPDLNSEPTGRRGQRRMLQMTHRCNDCYPPLPPASLFNLSSLPSRPKTLTAERKKLQRTEFVCVTDSKKIKECELYRGKGGGCGAEKSEREETDNRQIHSGPSLSLLSGLPLPLSPSFPFLSLLTPLLGPLVLLLTPLCQPSEVLSLSGRPSQISSQLKRPGRPG